MNVVCLKCGTEMMKTVVELSDNSTRKVYNCHVCKRDIRIDA